MTEEEVINERKNCPYVILSRAKGFHSKTPVPTCNRFHSNHTDNDLIGTYKQCCDIALEGNCKIKGMKEYEKDPYFLDGQFYFREIDIFQGEY